MSKGNSLDARKWAAALKAPQLMTRLFAHQGGAGMYVWGCMHERMYSACLNACIACCWWLQRWRVELATSPRNDKSRSRCYRIRRRRPAFGCCFNAQWSADATQSLKGEKEVEDWRRERCSEVLILNTEQKTCLVFFPSSTQNQCEKRGNARSFRN